MGFPIRKSADQRLFAPPHGLSQRTTSFIASQRQGIHRIPLLHLIALIIDAHHTYAPRQRRTRWFNTFSRTHQTGLDTKTSFASNTSGDGGQATSTAGYARCASNEKNPKVLSTLVAATGYVPSSRCRISARNRRQSKLTAQHAKLFERTRIVGQMPTQHHANRQGAWWSQQ